LDDPRDASHADVLILPGTKQTLDDLEWLRSRGFVDRLSAHSGFLIGICGGFQMLGLSIDDPQGVESAGRARTMAGLGLLPIRTLMGEVKTVRRATGKVCASDAPPLRGYEIHMGETLYESGATPFAKIIREGEAEAISDGAIAPSGRVLGTYIHGLFDDDGFRHSWLSAVRSECGLPAAPEYCFVAAEREAHIARWADHLRCSLDLDLIRGWIGGRA
jgi:adenosylcobyric acid synthase